MGARIYAAITGSFLSVDPVYGGNANAYGYPADPVNSFDLNGLDRVYRRRLDCGILELTLSRSHGGNGWHLHIQISESPFLITHAYFAVEVFNITTGRFYIRRPQAMSLFGSNRMDVDMSIRGRYADNLYIEVYALDFGWSFEWPWGPEFQAAYGWGYVTSAYKG